MPRDPVDAVAQLNPIPYDLVKGAVTTPEALSLLRSILATGCEPPPPPARRRPILVLAAVVALAGLVALVPALRHAAPLGATPAAAAALESLAATAEQQEPAFASPPGAVVLYTRTHTLGAVIGPGLAAFVPHTLETWANADGSVRRIDTSGTPRFLDEQSRVRWIADGMAVEPSRTEVRTRERWTFGYLPEGCDRDSCAVQIPISELPTDAARLGSLLEAYGASLERNDGQDPSAAAFRELDSVLSAPTTSPTLRAAAYRAASHLEGVRLLTGSALAEVEQLLASFGLYRPILVLALRSDDGGAGVRDELIVDRATAQVIGQRTVLLERTSEIDAAPPVVTDYEITDRIGWTTSFEDRPER